MRKLDNMKRELINSSQEREIKNLKEDIEDKDLYIEELENLVTELKKEIEIFISII